MAESKPKLHELLAVEPDLEKTAAKIAGETAKVFNEKQALFMGEIKRYEPFDEAEKAAGQFEEEKKLDTTVGKRLAYQMKHEVQLMDAKLQKERTNQNARADIEIDGKVVAKDLPATFLLGLETKLKSLRNIMLCIPTLQPGIQWDKDPDQGEGIYVTTTPLETFRTKKKPMSKVLYEATKEHPAQLENWFEDVNIGKFVLIKYSGMITPAEKSDMLGRLDKLSRAVKQARQRANCTEVVKMQIGKTITGFILGD